MIELSLREYKEYVSCNPELAAIIRKNGNHLQLISNIEHIVDQELFRVENMSFCLNLNLPFSESVVECRGRYAGGITFPLENCSSFDEVFCFFVEQSESQSYWLINDDTWTDVLEIDFFEAFVVLLSNKCT